MTERTDARELREKCIRRAELLRSTGFTGDASTADLLERAAAVLEKADDLRAENARLRERLEALERMEKALRCEKCGSDNISTNYRAPGEYLDGGFGTARSYFERVEVECLRRRCRRCGFRWTDPTLSTPAPAQRGDRP